MKKLSASQRLKALPLAALCGIVGQREHASELFTASISGRWEGSERNRHRNRPSRALESVDNGLDYGLREGLLSEGRALEQTFAICRRINRQYARHVVSSLRLKWNTGDTAIDNLYSKAWQNWMRMSDVQGRHTFRKLTKIAVCRTLVDGRIFGQLDRREGFLQVKGIEGDRVSSDGIFNADTPDRVAGIKIDGNGRAISAKVWNRTLYGQFENPQEIPFNQLVHVFDSDRIDSVSGVTAYASVLNTVRDLRETMLAERLSAKRNSKLALLVKTILGGASSPAVDLFNPDGISGNSSNDFDGRISTNPIGDVADAYMFPQEDMKAHDNPRPSNGWLNFMELLIREIAAGLDLPFGVVWHMSGLGGPAVRFEINQANRTFVSYLEDVIEPMWIRPIAGAWITQEISQKRLPFTPFWYRFVIPRPSALSIDFGRDSKAGIAENFAGLTTATDWYAEEDENFEDQTERLIYEARFRECRRRGIPFNDKIEVPLDQIRQMTPNGNPNAPQPATQEENDDEESLATAAR